MTAGENVWLVGGHYHGGRAKVRAGQEYFEAFHFPTEPIKPTYTPVGALKSTCYRRHVVCHAAHKYTYWVVYIADREYFSDKQLGEFIQEHNVEPKWFREEYDEMD